MTEAQATIIIELLRISSDERWNHFVAAAKATGYDPTDIVDAWQALADLSGMSSDDVPDVDEF